MTQTLSKRKRIRVRIQTSSSSSYNSNCWLAKGEFFRANEQAVSAEARLCETPPLRVECTISLLGQSSEEAKIQIWQLGAGFLTLLAHLQLLQFFFQNSFLLCAELSAAVSCWSKLCNSSPIQCKPKQCNVYHSQEAHLRLCREHTFTSASDTTKSARHRAERLASRAYRKSTLILREIICEYANSTAPITFIWQICIIS